MIRNNTGHKINIPENVHSFNKIHIYAKLIITKLKILFFRLTRFVHMILAERGNQKQLEIASNKIVISI